MAIENIDFDQATQQGLNATAELSKIANTIEKTGAYIQNEFEMQEVADTVVDIRKSAEQFYQDSGEDEYSFKNLFLPYKDKVLKAAKNPRVRRAINQEFEDRELTFNGKFYEKNKEKIKQTTNVKIAKTAESNNKIALEKFLSGDTKYAQDLHNTTIAMIENSSSLDEVEKYNLIQRANEEFRNIKYTAISQKAADVFDKNFNLDNMSYSQLQDKTPQDIVEMFVNREDLLKQFNISKKGNFYVDDTTGDIITDEQSQAILKNMEGEVRNVLQKKERDFNENKQKSDQNLNYMFEGMTKGKIYTEQQIDMVVNQTYKYNDKQGIELANGLRNISKSMSMGSIQEVKQKAMELYPQNLIMQDLMINSFAAAKTQEYSNAAEYYQQSGLSKSRVDFSSVDNFISSAKIRQDEVSGIAKNRKIPISNPPFLTNDEQKVLAETYKNYSPQEKSKFILSMNKSLGGQSYVQMVKQLSKIDPDLTKTMPVYAEMIFNQIPETTVGNYIKYEEMGRGISKDGYNSEYKTSLEMEVRKIAQKYNYPSSGVANAIVEQITNQFYGKLAENNVLTTEAKELSKSERQIIDNLFIDQMGEVQEVDPYFGRPTKFIALTGNKKDISIKNREELENKPKSFFTSVNQPYYDENLKEPQRFTVDRIMQNPNAYNFTPVKGFDKNGNPTTYHEVRLMTGEAIKGDDGRPYMIDFGRTEDLVAKTKREMAADTGYKNIFSRNFGVNDQEVLAKTVNEIARLKNIPNKTEEQNLKLKELTENQIRLSRAPSFQTDDREILVNVVNELNEYKKIPIEKQSDETKTLIKTLEEKQKVLTRRAMGKIEEETGVRPSFSEALKISYIQFTKDVAQTSTNYVNLLSSVVPAAQGIVANTIGVEVKKDEEEDKGR